MAGATGRLAPTGLSRQACLPSLVMPLLKPGLVPGGSSRNLYLCVDKLNVRFAPIEVPPGLGSLPEHLIQSLDVAHPLIF
jgi:hypothetical protein